LSIFYPGGATIFDAKLLWPLAAVLVILHLNLLTVQRSRPTLLAERSARNPLEVDDEAGLGYLGDAACALNLGRHVRHHGEAGYGYALAGREQRRTVDGLVEASEARSLLTAGYLSVTSYARVVTGVAV